MIEIDDGGDMSGDELKAERLARGMTQTEFGRWLAELLGSQPYAQPRVHDWESGKRSVPARVEVALLKERLKRKKRGGPTP